MFYRNVYRAETREISFYKVLKKKKKKWKVHLSKVLRKSWVHLKTKNIIEISFELYLLPQTVQL